MCPGIRRGLVAFVGNGRSGCFFVEDTLLEGEATSLNHEVGNDAVKGRVVIEPLIHVAEEIFYRDRRFVLI